MTAELFASCAILLLSVFGASQQVAGQNVDHLKAVCANEKQVDLSRASQLSDLAATAASLPADDYKTICSERSRLALVELDQLINVDNDNVCAPSKINQIRAYYKKFVDKKSLAKQHEHKSPKAIRNLFLSYGFEVSRICKTNMIGSLMSDAGKMLNEEDFEQVRKLTSDGSAIAKIIKTPRDVHDLILPKDIFVVLLKKASKKQDIGLIAEQGQDTVNVVLPAATVKLVKRLQAVCARRFRPIYEQLILPVVALSRVGLNYKGSDLDDHKNELKKNKQVHLWYRIVYLCESVSNLEAFEEPEPGLEGADRKLVRILSPAEAEQLRETQPPTGQPDEKVGEQIEYQVGAQHKLGDLLVDKDNKRVHKLVANFEANKSEAARIRSKVLRQVAGLMKEFLKNSKMNIVKGLWKSKGKPTNLSDQLIKLADGYANQMSANSTEDDDDDDDSSALALAGNGLRRVKRKDDAAFVVSMIFVAIAVVLILFVCIKAASG